MPDNESNTSMAPVRAPEANDQLVRLDVTHLRRGGMMQMLMTITDQRKEGEKEHPLLLDCSNIGVDQVFESIRNLMDCGSGLYRAELCDVDRDEETGQIVEAAWQLVRSGQPELPKRRVAGWRMFVCDVCRSVHILAAADFMAEAVEVCSCCQAEMSPQRGWFDERVTLNDQGQLTLPADCRTLEDFEAHVQKSSGTWVFHMSDDQENLKSQTELEAHRETLRKLQVGFVEFIVEEVATGEEVRLAWAEGTAHKVLDEIELDFSCHVSESGMDREPDADIENERFKFFEKELDRRYPQNS